MPYYNTLKPKIHLKYANGYTCLDHACLYYTAIKEEEKWINYINNLINSGEIINNQNVERAKAQVIYECRSMERLTFERERVVRFVTENRINHFAMGKVEEISQITCNDIKIWLNNIKKENKFYQIRFNGKKEIKEQIQHIKLKRKLYRQVKKSKNTFNEDKVFYITDIKNKKCIINLYLKLHRILSIEELVIKTFILCYIQYLCRKYLYIDTYVKEEYFTYSERYAVITLINVDVDDSSYIADKLRTCVESKSTPKELFYYKKLFYKYMKKVSLQNENNEDWVNKFYNYILYDIPIFDLKNVFELEDVIDKNIFTFLDCIIHQSLKVVVRSSRKFD